MLALKILGGVLALALGVWLGLPGRYEQTEDEIERRLGQGGVRNRTKRHFTPLDWLRKEPRASDKRRAGSRRRFTTAAPKGRGE